jgi:hypothetical protein
MLKMKALVPVLAGSIVTTAGAAMVAAPPQDRPGQPTQARVWIENRSPGEAIPVVVPGGVQIAGMPAVSVTGTTVVAFAPGTTVQTRLARQLWDYRVIAVPISGDIAPLLLSAGSDGWETAFSLPDPSRIVVVMKRPR